MLTDLPRDLAEEVLSRIPVTSLRGVRRTCKKWNTLSKDRSFTRRHISKEEAKRKEFQVVMILDYKVYLFSVNLLYPNCIERVGQLISLDDNADQVDISNIFHCKGLLLCIARDLSRLVVWNPCSGQTRWLQPRSSFNRWDRYALGYEMKNNAYSHKVLRFVDIYQGCMSTPPQLREFEIYNFNSNSWKVLDVNPDWDIENIQRGLSLHGNTYWFAQDKKILEGDPPIFLLCFDFTTERFGPRLPLPPFHPVPGDIVSLSSVRENQLAVLLQPISSCDLKIWISSKIEPNAVSWNKFLKVDLTPLTGFPFCLLGGTFFVDERKLVAVVLDKDRVTPEPTRNIAYIIGKEGYFKKVDLGESINVSCWPLVCSYVPSSVQINQAEPQGNLKTP